MEYKAIFHIDESDRWRLTLGNVENLLNAAGSSPVKAEVLANGGAVLQYVFSSHPNEIAQKMTFLHRRGVTFAACRNAMKAYHLEPEDLLAFVTTVPAGVMELVQKQAGGYAYIKP